VDDGRDRNLADSFGQCEPEIRTLAHHARVADPAAVVFDDLAAGGQTDARAGVGFAAVQAHADAVVAHVKGPAVGGLLGPDLHHGVRPVVELQGVAHQVVEHHAQQGAFGRHGRRQGPAAQFRPAFGHQPGQVRHAAPHQRVHVGGRRIQRLAADAAVVQQRAHQLPHAGHPAHGVLDAFAPGLVELGALGALEQLQELRDHAQRLLQVV
jgi:hypothetical protein